MKTDVESLLERLMPEPVPEAVERRLLDRMMHPARRTDWRMAMAASVLFCVVVFATVVAPSPAPHALQQAAEEKKSVPVAQGEDWLDSEPVPAAEELRAIQKLVAELGDEAPSVREAAYRALAAQIPSASSVLRQALKSDDAEVRHSAEKLLAIHDKQLKGKKLSQLVAKARKDAKALKDWPDVAAKALKGDADALKAVRKAGWAIAPTLVDAARTAELQKSARPLLRELLAVLADPRRSLKLTVRKDNDAYETSAYSFTNASQDVAEHHNYVQLVYNTCGSLHINPFGGSKNRIADLGAVDFATVKVPEEGWKEQCVRPREGHVYVLEIGALDKQPGKDYVKFIVTSIGDDGELSIEWVPMGEELRPLGANSGANGTMGACGGRCEDR